MKRKKIPCRASILSPSAAQTKDEECKEPGCLPDLQKARSRLQKTKNSKILCLILPTILPPATRKDQKDKEQDPAGPGSGAGSGARVAEKAEEEGREEEAEPAQHQRDTDGP